MRPCDRDAGRPRNRKRGRPRARAPARLDWGLSSLRAAVPPQEAPGRVRVQRPELAGDLPGAVDEGALQDGGLTDG